MTREQSKLYRCYTNISWTTGGTRDSLQVQQRGEPTCSSSTRQVEAWRARTAHCVPSTKLPETSYRPAGCQQDKGEPRPQEQSRTDRNEGTKRRSGHGKAKKTTERWRHADGKDKGVGREENTKLNWLKSGPGEMEGLSVQSTCCSYRGAGLDSQHTHGGLQPPTTPVPGIWSRLLTSSPPVTQVAHVHTSRQKVVYIK